MIDYFALALGHGLMVVALLRLVLRDGLDADPLLEQIASATADQRKSLSVSARNAARRARTAGDTAGDDAHANPADVDARARAQTAPR